MRTIVLGHHNKEYLIQLYYYAKRLGAEDMTVHRDGSITLICEYGYICERYRPTAKELKRRYEYERI